MSLLIRLVPCAVALSIFGSASVAMADEGRVYAGVLLGVSTLSADGNVDVAFPVAHASLYTPRNGPAVSGVLGADLHRYISIQASYVANSNRVTFLSSSTDPGGGTFTEHARDTTQQAWLADLLVFVRPPDSAVRPYFSLGAGVMRFGGRTVVTASEGRSSAPDRVGSKHPTLRVAVGIDIRLSGPWRFRYTFSDTVSPNPLSQELQPSGTRPLANFHSLFGMVHEW